MELDNISEQSEEIHKEKSSFLKNSKKRTIFILIVIFFFLILFAIIIWISLKPKKLNNIELKESEFYTKETKEYLNLIKNLEESNKIAYNWNIKKDINNELYFINKYSHQYEKDTSLKPINDSISKYLFTNERFLKTEADEKKYYDYLGKEAPEHFVYGPTYAESEFLEKQYLYSTNTKLNLSGYDGLTISFNVRAYKSGNSNNGFLFGWGNQGWNTKGCFVGIDWGVLNFKCGTSTGQYSYEDSVSLGFDDTIPEKRYLTYRPLTGNSRWHQIVLKVSNVTEDELPYLNQTIFKIGTTKVELLFDGSTRKNITGKWLDDYGDLTVFKFNSRFQNKNGVLANVNTDNKNWYIGNILVIKKPLTLNEINIIYNNIDQEADVVLPDVSSKNRCHIPGVKWGINPTDIYKESKIPLTAETKVFHFTNKWTCLGFSYKDFIAKRIREYCGFNLDAVDKNYMSNNLQDYQFNYQYLYSTTDVLAYYLDQIESHFMNLSSFQKYITITSTNKEGLDKQIHKIVNFGYWLSSEGVMNIPTTIPFEQATGNRSAVTSNPETNYFAYFEMEYPYVYNRIYTIQALNSEPQIFTYDNSIISHAIKINQNGYVPNVNHYAYIGRWMGTSGSLPLEEWVGKPFKIYQNNHEIFSNKIKWRLEKDQNYTGDSRDYLINGEVTLLLDFSEMPNKGDDFYIYVEGIGRSLPFSISNSAIFNAFYTHMKGLYQQRTGIEHVKPYTNWEYGAHHKGIYVAHHIPNENHYSSIYDVETNKPIDFKITQFDMIKAIKTEEFWEDVYGGHADAGDYDNRPYHLKIVYGLAAGFLLKKDLMMDNQLNIPESNDGIPDILNELEWNLEIHYRAQNRFNNGGVSTWIESTSHPSRGDPGNDSQRYYIGLQTREDTLNYAKAAGLLAICFKYCNKCNQKAKEIHFNKWKNSALWAWNFAMNESNRCEYYFDFNRTINNNLITQHLVYREPDIPDYIYSGAALVIYNLTDCEKIECEKFIFKNKKSNVYSEIFTDGIKNIISRIRYPDTIEGFPLCLFIDNPNFEKAIITMKDSVNNVLVNLWNYQDDATNYTYRNAYFYPANHYYYKSLGWGNFNGGPMIEYHLLSSFLNKDDSDMLKKTKQGLSYYYDFSMGCNHFGRSFTTGLGHVYPLRLLSHPNWWLASAKNIWDPIPGITLYTFTGEVEYAAIKTQYRYIWEKNEDYDFQGYSRIRAPFMFNITNPPVNDYAQSKELIYDYLPFWHRGSNHEENTVASSEFTVWETIYRMALETIILLEKDEDIDCNSKSDCPSIFPTNTQLNKGPKDIKDHLGRWSIP